MGDMRVECCQRRRRDKEWVLRRGVRQGVRLRLGLKPDSRYSDI